MTSVHVWRWMTRNAITDELATEIVKNSIFDGLKFDRCFTCLIWRNINNTADDKVFFYKYTKHKHNYKSLETLKAVSICNGTCARIELVDNEVEIVVELREDTEIDTEVNLKNEPHNLGTNTCAWLKEKLSFSTFVQTTYVIVTRRKEGKLAYHAKHRLYHRFSIDADVSDC